MPAPDVTSSRKAVALVTGVVLAVAVVTLFALAINRFDWGVGLMLLAPLVTWLVLRLGRWLERWASGAGNAPPIDPDFPDDAGR